jgi:hypothetical protein
MATRKEAAVQRVRGPKGHFVKSGQIEKYNLPASIVPNAGVSHVSTFQAIPQLPSLILRNLDEALRHDPQNARAMRRDTFLMRLLFTRQMAVSQLPWELVADDPKDPFQAYACQYLTEVINDIPRFTEFKRNLLEAVWYGRYAIVNNFGFDWKDNRRRFVVKSWQPIMGDKLQFRQDSDEIGYLVNPARLSGLRPMEMAYDGPVEMFSGTDRRCVVVHKHFLTDAHYTEGEFAGGINGTGLRHWIYWAWLHKQELLAWVFNTMERFGAGGFQIWYFESGNSQSENAVREAAEKQTANNVILFPRPIGTEKQGPGLEILEPKGTGIDMFLKLIDDYFDRQIRQMIIGDSAEDDSTDQSTTTTEREQMSFQRILQYDADNLAETLNRELVQVLLDYNFPGANYKVKMKYNVLKPDPNKLLEASQRFWEIGGAIAERELRAYIGLSEPEPGDKILQKPVGADNSIRTPQKQVGNLGENLS